ncbi:hypothetical protein Riv7116_0724 [Rivularia sp. PCC 7116]|uniref:hypothetical protein n=1 Tax=Rivularia sp. PCC 7116 TaxID=373994 RepID=UPI00029F3BD7|nr:hypothetical protein [Rivularia sp. PCC 7116]AFY53312.1 hypothetical protein Riv7116_0724 [Rivularia sp. PCC 7116]
MKQQHLRFLIRPLTKKPLAIQAVIASSIVLLAGSGCSNKSQNNVQLEIQGIQREDGKGLYKVVGSTNLPESSRIAITAVRYLRPTTTTNAEQIVDDNNENINRSILARQIVEVKQGKWEADLNLWQVASNGNFQEVWQLNKDYKNLLPENEVTFIATFNPVAQLPSSDNQNFQQNLEGKSLRFTNEGEKYVQTSQYRSIGLPIGKTASPRPEPEDFNDGWGIRYQLKAQSEDSTVTLPPLAKSHQTNIPISSSEFLR